MVKRRVSSKTVQRVAKLARIAVDGKEARDLGLAMGAILEFADILKEVNVAGVEPMTWPGPMRLRTDEVTAADDVLFNAPERVDRYFAVPKVLLD